MELDVLVTRSKIAALLVSATLVAVPAITQSADKSHQRKIDTSRSLNFHGTPLAGKDEIGRAHV